MIFSKFNSRPPFERKKPTELYDNSCCGNRAIIEEPKMRKINKHRATEPKVLEKVSPSIQTLYRNSNACRTTGRNVPRHTLMKKLLRNFDSDADTSRKSSTKKNFFAQNEVIRTDFNVNCGTRKSGGCKVTISNDSPQKVDRQTSTTGLNASSCCKCCESKIATKEEPNFYKLPAIMSQRSLRSEQNTFRTIRKVAKRPDNDNSSVNFKPKKLTSTKIKDSNREKTFVQIQVERLDKELKLNTKLPITYNTNNIASRKIKATSVGHNKNKPHKKLETKDRPTKHNTAAYLELMNKVKNAYPQLHHSHNPVNSDGGWSDYSLPEECVKFPKETRTAMDQGLYERRPLSKFTNVQHCRPAVNIVNDNRCFGDCHEAEMKLPKFNKDKHRVGKSKLLVPCKKNLLCDKGEYHVGTCGYTHCNRSKLIY